jgi:hypothetical protein
MPEILAVFGALLGFSTLAGYAPVRFLGRSLPPSDRHALTPVTGASLIALLAVWIHCFLPFRGTLELKPPGELAMVHFKRKFNALGQCSVPPLEPGNGDTRRMSVQVVNPQIEVIRL